MEQRTQEWFEARKGRVTASAIGAIIGTAPYMTRDDVMRAMVREYHGVEREFQGNIATEYGTHNEPVAFMQFRIETGLVPEECGFFSYGERFGASPDGLVGDDAVLEIKCPFGLRKEHEPVFKSIHEMEHYYAQVQWQMMCTGRKLAYFFQWAPNGTRLEIVDFNPEYCDQLMYESGKFIAELDKELGNKDHLEPLRKVVTKDAARRLVDEIVEIDDSLEILKERRIIAMELLIEQCGGVNSEIAGKKLTIVKRKGSIDYAKVAKDHLGGVDLEPYRRDGSQSWRLS